MRKRILSVLVSVSMALLLVPAVPFAMANVNEDGTGEVVDSTPVSWSFATQGQLMTEFSSKSPTNIGKLLFGKNDQGKPQEWYIFGKDNGVPGDNVMVFAATPLVREVVFRELESDGTIASSIEYSDDWECVYDEATPHPDKVSPNHYGSSSIRMTLQAIAQDGKYFTSAEQDILNASAILTHEPNRKYSTTERLYLPDTFTWGQTSCVVGSSTNFSLTFWGLIVADEYTWNGDTSCFWTRQYVSNYDGFVFAANGASKSYDVLPVFSKRVGVRPAGNLNLKNVLFASAAEASASGVKAGTIEAGKAMTLRMGGSSESVGSATYDAGNGVIVASAATNAAGPVSLVVQGKDGDRDWYFSKRLDASQQGGTQATVGQIERATGASSVDLSTCKIWVENTDASARMTYAVPAKPASINVTTIDSVELTGMTPTADQQLPAAATCSTEGISSPAPAITYTTGGSAATGDAKWGTTYKAELTLKAQAASSSCYVFADSVTATVDGEKLDAALLPDVSGNLTVTCEFTTKMGKVFEIAGLTVPAGNTFASYYGFDGYDALPTGGSELGSAATFVYRGNSANEQAEVEGVIWELAGGASYDPTPGAVNTFRWTIPAGSLADYDVSSCKGYYSITGNVTGTVKIANKAATPVSITEAEGNYPLQFNGYAIEDNVERLFVVDQNAGARSYSLAGGTGQGTLSGATLTIKTPGTYEVRLETAANGIYAAGEKTVTVTAEPSWTLAVIDFGTAVYGSEDPAPQAATFVNNEQLVIDGKPVPVRLEQPASTHDPSNFVIGALSSDEVAYKGTATFTVQPQAGLKPGTYVEYVALKKKGGVYPFTYACVRYTVEKASPKLTITPASSTVLRGEAIELTVSSDVALPEGAALSLEYKQDVGLGAAEKVPLERISGSCFRAQVPAPPFYGRYRFLAKFVDTTGNYNDASAECEVSVSLGITIDPPANETTVDVGSNEKVGVVVSGGQAAVKEISPELLQTITTGEGSGLQSSLVLDLSSTGSKVTSTKISKESVQNIAGAANSSGGGLESLTVNMSIGSVELNKKAVSSIAEQAAGEVTIGLSEKPAFDLGELQQVALEAFKALYGCYEASVTSGGNEIHEFGSGAVTLSFPFKPAPNTDPKNYRLAHVSETGKLEYCPTTLKGNVLSGTTTHLSTYAIVYIEPAEETLALAEALGALPAAGELKAADAEAAVAQARGLLAEVAALADDQRAIMDEALVRGAEQVVARGTELIEEADAKAVKKVKNKSFSVKAGKSKSIAFKTKASAAGTKVVYKKTKGSKHITVTKAGKVTAKKGLKPGKTYTAKVKVTCGKAYKTVKVTVKVK